MIPNDTPFAFKRNVGDGKLPSAVIDLPGDSFYHSGYGRRRDYKLPLEKRKFVVWDGEGASTGIGIPQDYVLLGCYDGITHERITARSLSTSDCLAFIVRMGKAHPGAWHVSFAFDYDVNMILRDLSMRMLKTLRLKGHVFIGAYRLEHIPGKWFRITTGIQRRTHKRGDKKRKTNQRMRESVTIQDIFSFFQCSLIKALRRYIPTHELMVAHIDSIEEGKSRRSTFVHDDLSYVEEYWRIENMLLHALICELRSIMYSVDLRITKWYGPGVLANYTYRVRGIKDHKSDCGEKVYDAARYAYAGGRFELFRIGRHENVYGLDINSAYPAAISKLPSLSEGNWRYNEKPTRIVEFGVYHIRLRGSLISRKPGPLFHRDDTGNISFPWITEGWYWSPEIRAMINTGVRIELVAGWEYVDWATRPFGFVTDLYNERARMKRDKEPGEAGLKLCLNSMYGKMAQRAGWNRSGKAPTWHQLEWAGWVTSYTRAKLYELMTRIPWECLVAVETDGVFTTMPGLVTAGKGLGEWDVTEFDEMVYLQSGVYAKRIGKDWTSKYRGLDASSVSTEQIVNHTKLLLPNTEWPSLRGTTTRFVGYRQALMSGEDFRKHHCVWETNPKEISCGNSGKRVHVPRLCKACEKGANAYDMAHDLVIQSSSHRGRMSEKHDIPWLEPDKAVWREYEDMGRL